MRHTFHGGIAGVATVLALTVAPAAGAQSLTLQDDWRVARFDTRSGLPADAITHLAESRDGVVWAATTRGLAWFDGWRWRTVDADSPGVPLRMARMLRAGPGNTVLAVVHNLLFIGDTVGFRKIPLLVGGSERQVEGAVAWGTGVLALARVDSTRAALVLLTDSTTAPFAAPDSLFDPNALSLHPAAGGGAWLNTRTGLWRWRRGQWDLAIATDGDRAVVSALVDHPVYGGVLSRYSDRFSASLWEWKPGQAPTQRLGEGEQRMTAAAFGPEGRVLALYQSGYLRERRGGTWAELTAGPSVTADGRTVLFDRQGDLWIGTGAGLVLYRESSRQWAEHLHGFPDGRDMVSALLPMPDGTLWVGTFDGIEVLDSTATRTVRAIHHAAGVRLGVVTGLARDSAGSVWVSSGSAFPGALRFDGRVWSRVGPEQGLGGSGIHSISVDRGGRVWFAALNPGTQTGPGAFVLEGDQVTHWATERDLPSGRVYAVADGPDGSRWFGTAAGLSRWKAGRWTHWTRRAVLVGGRRVTAPLRVFTLAVDRDGRPWFGDNRAELEYGLGTLDAADSLRLLGTEHGLPSNTVWQVAIAPDGTVWAATDGGLAAVREGLVFPFGPDRGLTTPRVWPLAFGDQRVFAGTRGGGLRVLNLGSLAGRAPRLEVEETLVEGRRAYVRWNAQAWRGSLPPALVEARYRLDRGPWSAWSTQRAATLTGLRPGVHRVAFQAKGLYFPVDTIVAGVDLRVDPPLLLRPVLFVPFLLLTGLVLALVVVITRRKREAATALRESEARFRALHEASFEGLGISVDGVIVEANERLGEILGCSRDALIGRQVMDFIAPESQDTVRAHFQRRSEVPYEHVALRADGASVPVEVRSRSLTYQGQPARFTAIRDMTDRRQLEAQLLQSQKMEAVGQLAGGVAHDFNNLLTSILGHADLLAPSLRDGEAHEDLEEIQRAATRAAELTKQLLTFARRQRIVPRVIDVNVLVSQLDRLLRRLLGEHILYVTQTGVGVQPVRMDPGQLEQVLVNLAVNARDAMPEGGQLTIETGMVRLDPEYLRDHPGVLPGSYTMIAVTDTGVGMPSWVRERIFEPFFTTKEVGKGTGLGLAICYGIVRQAGGHLGVYSEPGRGTTVKVYLPPTADRPSEGAATEQPRYPGGGETILLVEDEPAVSSLITRVLTRAGYEVVTAGNGDEVPDALARATVPPTLLVTDIVLPGRSGPEVARRLRGQLPGLKVLYISGYPERGVNHHATLDAPFLPKPFTPQAIARAVRDALDGSEKSRT